MSLMVSRTAGNEDVEPAKKKIKVEAEDLCSEADLSNLQNPRLDSTVLFCFNYSRGQLSEQLCHKSVILIIYML